MKHYLDISELAERLRVKRSTLYAWAEQRMIPHLKVGRLLRFDPDDIEAWIQTHRREAAADRLSHRYRRTTETIDTLIAQAKRDAYTSLRGKPDSDRATRKEKTNGSV